MSQVERRRGGETRMVRGLDQKVDQGRPQERRRRKENTGIGERGTNGREEGRRRRAGEESSSEGGEGRVCGCREGLAGQG